MNVLHWFNLALLTDAARPFHNILLRAFPSYTIGVWRSSFPAWMGFPFIEFRLPFSHARTRAKRLDGMKVGGGSAKVLQALNALLCDSVPPGQVRFSNLGRDTARERAKFLVSFPCTAGWLPAGGADGSFRRTPSIQQVTFCRAKGLFRSTILRMKSVPTLCAASSFIAFHVHVVTQTEEKYCEIAVKRLAQGVLAL